MNVLREAVGYRKLHPLASIWVSLISVVLSASAFLVSYWNWESRRPIVTLIPISVEQPAISGEYLVITWQYVKRKDCPGNITPYFVNHKNSAHYALQNRLSSLPATSEHQVKQVKIHYYIYPSIPPGSYQLVIAADYQCNPIFITRQRLPDRPVTVQVVARGQQ